MFDYFCFVTTYIGRLLLHVYLTGQHKPVALIGKSF